MKSFSARMFLLSSLALAAAACGEMEAAPVEGEAVAAISEEVSCSLGDPDAPGAVEVGAGCGSQYLYDTKDEDDELRVACPGPDRYFHPNNGSHGGWIEAWRLCHVGGDQYKICTGGYAPVRYWNLSSCGGTVHDYYPQGWHGWVQTSGVCC